MDAELYGLLPISVLRSTSVAPPLPITQMIRTPQRGSNDAAVTLVASPLPPREPMQRTGSQFDLAYTEAACDVRDDNCDAAAASSLFFPVVDSDSGFMATGGSSLPRGRHNQQRSSEPALLVLNSPMGARLRQRAMGAGRAQQRDAVPRGRGAVAPPRDLETKVLEVPPGPLDFDSPSAACKLPPGPSLALDARSDGGGGGGGARTECSGSNTCVGHIADGSTPDSSKHFHATVDAGGCSRIARDVRLASVGLGGDIPEVRRATTLRRHDGARPPPRQPVASTDSQPAKCSIAVYDFATWEARSAAASNAADIWEDQVLRSDANPRAYHGERARCR